MSISALLAHRCYISAVELLCASDTRATGVDEETLHEDVGISKEGRGEGFRNSASFLENPQEPSETMELANHK